MAQENYIEGCSIQRPPLIEPNGFCFWKARFETYVKSKDIDLWLKNLEERCASFSGLEAQISGFQKQVADLNGKLSISDAAFAKSKFKGKKRKKKIKFLMKNLGQLNADVARLISALNQATVVEAERDAEILWLKASPPELVSVMAISVISISSDSSEDSVGTPAGRVILFGTIPTTIPDTTPVITPPTTHIDTTPIPTISPTIPPSPDYTPASPDYSPVSDTEFDPSEDPSSDHIPPLLATSPFLSSIDNSSDSDTPYTLPSPTHGTSFTETTLSTQRSPVASGALRRQFMVLALEQPIPHGRPFRYHLNGTIHMMTTRKRVGPLPTHRLAVRHSVDYSSSYHFSSKDSSRDSLSSSPSETFSDSSADALSDSESSRSFSNHSSATPSSGMRPSHHSCSLVPSIHRSSAAISERPSYDSSFASPSRKRSRSSAASVPLSSPTLGALSYARADLLPSPKRIRSPEIATDLEGCSEDNFEPYVPREAGLGVDFEDESSGSSRHRGTHLEMDVDVMRSDGIDIDLEIQAEINECITYADALRDKGIDARVVVEAIDREEIETSMRGPVKVRVDRVTYPVVVKDILEPSQEGVVEVIESVQRDRGHMIVAKGQQSADMSKRIRELERDNMRLRDMMDVASQRVARSQRRELRVQREMRQIRRFRFYDRMRIARLEACAKRRLGYPRDRRNGMEEMELRKRRKRNGRNMDHRNGGIMELSVVGLTAGLRRMEKCSISVLSTEVMAISVISISSDSSEDSVGTPAGRVILFGTIPNTIPDTTPVITPPATQTDTPTIPTETPIIAPTIPPSPYYTPTSPDYSPASDSESNPSEDPSSDHIPPLPAILQFLSSDDDTTNSDTPPSPTHDTPFTKITSSTQRSPIIPCRQVMTLSPGQPIPYGRPYRYHLNGPMHMITARKRVGPLPTHCLAMIHFANHSSSDSSSEASSDFHLDASFDSSSRHLLSDHSSPDLPSTSTWPSRKRHRSPMTYVPVLSLVSGALSPVRADLIPSPKRVKDSGYLADIEAEIDECIAYTNALKDRGIDARVDIPELAQEGAVEVTYETLGDLVQRFHDHTQAIPVYRIQAIEGVLREQGHRMVRIELAVIASTKRIVELERDNIRLRGTMSVESQRVDRLQRGMLCMQRELRQMR
ncbi:hypothetical protein Tco_0017830 [Tanacetum coccineum]